MSAVKRIVFVLSWLVLILPASAYAQATLAGVIKDSSGAVLPGTTVEASSAALIEKSRTALSDSTGQYKITELPPGTYAVTFTLAGFTTVKREAVEVSGAGVITINADLRVGSVSETITVSGETPIVDVQSAQRQEVLTNDVLKTLPATRCWRPCRRSAAAASTSTCRRRCAFSRVMAGAATRGTCRWTA
jgi:hypothetical protein